MARKEFTSNQLKRSANILDNAGQVFLATLVLAPLISGRSISKSMLFLGIGATIFVWWVSLYIERRIK